MDINKIYNEDCLDTMGRMPNEFIDLVVTSPPYDNLRTYNGYSFEFEKVANELHRVMKVGGVIVWVVGDATINGSETGTSFKQALYFKNIGFNLHDTMIYAKNNPIPRAHNRYESQFEYMFVFSKGRLKTFNPIFNPTINSGRILSKTRSFYKNNSDTPTPVGKVSYVKGLKIKNNIWFYNVGNHYKEKIKHPAIFPEQLANDHIISWSNVGDLVYDPFMGSGTTAKMSVLNNRNYIGSEISLEYFKISEFRLRHIQFHNDVLF